MRFPKNWKKTYLVPVIVGAGLFLASSYFCSHYKLMFTFGSDKCLPGSVFVVEIGAKPKVGQLALFKSPKTDLLPEGLNIIKIVAGGPGDSVDVTPYTVVNGIHRYSAPIESAAKFLNADINTLVGTKRVEPDRYFMLGIYPGSYDSRFFGTISKERMVGRAFLLI